MIPVFPLTRVMHRLRVFILLVFMALACPSTGGAMNVTTPISVSNQSPLVQIYGLPGMERSRLLAPGQKEARFSLDLSSHFVRQSEGSEAIFLDGETYRYGFRFDIGLSERLEVGFEVPFVDHRGGSLDGFIDSWHRFFNLPRGGRQNFAEDQLIYAYQQGGATPVDLRKDVNGLGDIKLHGAWQIISASTDAEPALALRGSLKIPTGDAGKLTGSGSTDLALWCSGSRAWPSRFGPLGLMGSLGGLFIGNGDVLSGQQRPLVAFGGLSLALAPWSGVRLQLQLDAHSPFYESSRIRALEGFSAQLSIGGSIQVSASQELELAVVEDVAVETAPDVVFHLAFRQRF